MRVAGEVRLLDALDGVLPGSRYCSYRAFLVADLELNVFNFGIEVELHACLLQIFLHGQDHRLVLVVAGEAQGAEVG